MGSENPGIRRASGSRQRRYGANDPCLRSRFPGHDAGRGCSFGASRLGHCGAHVCARLHSGAAHHRSGSQRGHGCDRDVLFRRDHGRDGRVDECQCGRGREKDAPGDHVVLPRLLEPWRPDWRCKRGLSHCAIWIDRSCAGDDRCRRHPDRGCMAFDHSGHGASSFGG